MKAVILARGRGTRMQRPNSLASVSEAQARMADAGLKAMIPFRRPFLDYVLSALADAGCLDVCLVIGGEHDVVRDYYTRIQPPERVRVAFAVQERPLGTADAVLAAEPFAGGGAFLALNADTYYPPDVLAALTTLDGPALPAFRRSTLVAMGNIEPERILNYAVLLIGPGGDLLDIIEKPDRAALATFGDEFFVSANCWRFGPEIFDACRRISLSARGELELPEAVRFAIRTLHVRFRAVPMDAGVLDLSHRADIAEIERRLEGIEARP